MQLYNLLPSTTVLKALYTCTFHIQNTGTCTYMYMHLDRYSDQSKMHKHLDIHASSNSSLTHAHVGKSHDIISFV